MTGQIITNVSRSQNAFLKQRMAVSSDVKMNRNFVLFVIAHEAIGALEMLFGLLCCGFVVCFFNNQSKTAVVSDVWVIQIH